MDPDLRETGCHCKPEWRAYYHAATGGCYEQESKGPCPVGQYFAFNVSSQAAECSCFRNFVRDPRGGGVCVEQFTRGPCEDGQLVVPAPGNVLGCDCGPHMADYFWPPDGRCYPHYERGPCKAQEQFRKNPTTKEQGPVCIVWGQTSPSDGYRR